MSIERVRSTCSECGKEDDHPKHYPDEHPHHLDCGRSIGCSMCDAMLRASGERHGEDLTRFMKSRVAEPTGV